MSARNRVELKRHIRFQLSQLSARNAEHEFENLAFELARLRLVPNLLPATGPVQAGGDQGRDFESYRTYLAKSQLGTSTFVTAARDRLLVGACTLDKKIIQKIKKDLRSIFSFGERPAHVVYFCEPDVPVAKRHALQEHCSKSYGASLEIFDGQAISDLLADRDTFWIAEQFLSIPSDAWPDEPIDSHYACLRSRWCAGEEIPRSYSDFLDIKQGLRTATFEEEAKRDLVAWIKAMSVFLDGTVPDRLAQKARYEIAVAELRGRGSLDPALNLVEKFFKALSPERAPAELLDAGVLAVYVWGAKAHGQTSVEGRVVKNWVHQVGDLIDLAIAGTSRRGDRCMLLEARAMLGSTPVEAEVTSEEHQARFFELWKDVVQEVKETPFYPVIHIARILEQVTPIMGKHPSFRSLVNDVDALIADRAGAAAVADRARRRAIAQLDAGNHVAAIDELQRTKVGWFTGETMEGSILAMLLISQSFEALHLHAAARYYAAGAFYLALSQENEQVKTRLGQAAFRLADTFHAAGEGVTFFHSLGQALAAHQAVASDADNWTKHSQVQRSVAHAVILRAIARRVAPSLLPLIDDAIEQWPLPLEERNNFISLSERDPWSTIPVDDVEHRIAEDLGQHPFGDVGAERSITWSAFGITWTVRSQADREAWLATLEVAATLQIAQVEFADTDLLIIPSHVFIDVELANIINPQVRQLPDNGRLAWNIAMPRHVPEGRELNDLAFEVAAVAVTVLGQATALPFEAFRDLCDERYERGLATRLFSVRPARELMGFALPRSLDLGVLSSHTRPELRRSMQPIESAELKWYTGPGPGYSRSQAEEFLQNRYRLLAVALRLTLPKVLKDQRGKSVIRKLRDSGLLDWQILAVLANIVGQYQVEQQLGRVPPPILAQNMRDRLFREEREDDPSFDVNYLTDELVEIQQGILSAAAFHTWQLACHRQTPDFIAMKRLLDERYGHSVDDIPHDDPFPGLTQPPLAA